ALRRRKDSSTEANHLKATSPHRTIAMRYHIWIKGAPVVAILDSGAAQPYQSIRDS
ncbi:25646_t:CDS:2, partial [Dentiscutata erythropus]